MRPSSVRPAWVRQTLAAWLRREAYLPTWGPYGKRWPNRPEHPPLWTNGHDLLWYGWRLASHKAPGESQRFCVPGNTGHTSKLVRDVVRTLQEMFPVHTLDVGVR